MIHRLFIQKIVQSHQSTTAHQTTSDIGRRKDLRCIAIVSSRLDYCNSVLQGTSAANLDRLQRVKDVWRASLPRHHGLSAQLIFVVIFAGFQSDNGLFINSVNDV